MKKCIKCGRTLPLSEFYKQKSGDGLRKICKDCSRKYMKANYNCGGDKKLKKQILKAMDIDKANETLGGVKCYILNHVKENEFKFNVVRTDGFVYKTNNKNDFINFLKEKIY